MNNPRCWAKPLMWLHLFVCVAWLCLFRGVTAGGWIVHIFIWSILAIQFTWGFTIGLLVGPARKDRDRLWWALLPVFMPLWFTSLVTYVLRHEAGVLVAAIYFSIFVMILACETYCGVLLGAKTHAEAGK